MGLRPGGIADLLYRCALSHLRAILDFGLQIADLLYRCALSHFIKLTEYLKSKIQNPKLSNSNHRARRMQNDILGSGAE